MIRTPKLLLELSPFSPSSEFLVAIRNAAKDGGKLSDLETTFQAEAKKKEKNVNTSNEILIDIQAITEHPLNPVNINGIPSYEYVDGTFVITTNCIMHLLKLYITLHKSERKGMSRYKIDQIKTKIKELGELPVLAAVIPSEIFVLEEGTLFIKELGQTIDLSVPYLNSGKTLKHNVNTEGLLDMYLNRYVTNGDTLLHETIKKELFSLAGKHDLSEIYSATEEVFIPVDVDNLYSFSLSASQRALLKNDLIIGVSIASMAHRLFNRDEYTDVQGHLKGIGSYLDAFKEMKGHNDSLKYLSEQTDVNLGYAVADSLVPLATHAAVVARFLNAFEHIATYLHTAVVTTNEKEFNVFKWMNVIKSPV